MSKKWKNNDIIGSADAQRWEDKPNAQDLVNLKNTIESGNVKTADKLKTARKIALTGNATGSAFFDGSKDVNVSVSVSSASIKNKGLVQLTNDLNSNSEQLAPTAKSVKYLNTELSKKADKSAAQMHKLTKDNGLLYQFFDGDFNEILKTGFYAALGCKNNPPFPNSSNFFFLRVFNVNNMYVQQIAQNVGTRELFIRRSTENGWSNWHLIATDEDLSKKADIDKAQMYKLTRDTGEVTAIPGKDLNTLLQPGFYIGYNFKNHPFGTTALVEVYKEWKTIFQIFTATNGKKAHRVQREGVWSDWVRVATSIDSQMFKLTRDDGRSKVPTTKNLDNLKTTGDYYEQNFTNSPFSKTDWLNVKVTRQLETTTQFVINTNNSQIAVRNGNDRTGWRPWKVIK